MGSTQRITNVQTFCSNADFTKARKPIETKVNTFLFMYMNLSDVIICYLELRKTRSVFPIPLEFEISKFACIIVFTAVKNCCILHRHVCVMAHRKDSDQTCRMVGIVTQRHDFRKF